MSQDFPISQARALVAEYQSAHPDIPLTPEELEEADHLTETQLLPILLCDLNGHIQNLATQGKRELFYRQDLPRNKLHRGSLDSLRRCLQRHYPEYEMKITYKKSGLIILMNLTLKW